MAFQLSSVLQQLESDLNADSCAILIDAAFAEYVKWSGDDSSLLKSKFLCLPFTRHAKESAKLLSLHKTQRAILFISSDLTAEIESIQFVLQSSPVQSLTLFTTMNNQLTESLDIADAFPTTEVSVIYCPFHAMYILPPSQQSVGIFTLTNSSIKSVSPLTLHNLGLYQNSSYDTVSQITAEDIPAERRAHLKQLAHELAGALLYNLGMDPTGSVFAMGHTSHLIGNTIQPIVAHLLTEAREASPCSLLLIDRTEDIYTPSAYHSSAPLIQRLVCTLSRQTIEQEMFCDIAIAIPDAFEPVLVTPASTTLQHPLSAVTGLPFRLLPSIRPPSTKDLPYTSAVAPLQRFVSSLYLHSEETTREHLMLLLNLLLQEENCSPPPAKKRGFGAEVLANVQALLQCGTSEAKGYNPEILLRTHCVVSLCIAIIESMQRSSEKQLSQCIKDASVDVTSYEVLVEVEQAMLSRIADYWNTIECVSQEWISSQLDEILQLLTRIGARNVLLLLTRFVALIAPKSKFSDIEFLLQKVTPAIEKHVRITCSAAEMHNLKFLSKDLIADILNYRSNDVASDDLSVRLQMELRDLISDSLRILLEVSHSNVDIMSAAAKKQKEKHKKSKEMNDPISLSGLLGSTCKQIFDAKANGTRDVVDRVKLIDNPLRKLARKGLGLLTQGLGRFGFSGNVSAPEEPHLVDAPNLVIFVVGGVSYAEVKQIQDAFIANQSFKRVIVGSSRIVTPDDMVGEVFEAYVR